MAPSSNTNVLLDNHWTSCTCDEWLNGVKTQLRNASFDGDPEKGPPKR